MEKPIMNNLKDILPIDEFSELYADAVLTDEAGSLLFLSVWGHDTGIKEFIARLSLPLNQGGLTHFRVGRESHEHRLVSISNVDNLEKLTGKTPDDSVFGGLCHLQLYDRLFERYDYANSRALMLCSSQVTERLLDVRLWSLVQQLCYVPQCNHWKEPVLEFLRHHEMITLLDGIGINGIALNFDQTVIEKGISEMVQRRILPLDPNATARQSVLEFLGNPLTSGDSRAQAIEDGTLVDVSEHAVSMGYQYPVALTSSVWEDCVEWSDSDTLMASKERNHRLATLLSVLRGDIRSIQPGAANLLFSVGRVPNDGCSNQMETVELKCVVSGGDDHQPVITIMSPREN
jgi:Family of unknown function (DUF6573)